MENTKYTEYQQKTICRVLDQFSKKPPVKRMLCSDEVGLGKTYVAKGVIRAMAWKRILEGRDRLDVLYLCPNLNIAAQNKAKLGITSGSDSEEERKNSAVENRSSMLYLQVLRQQDKSIPANEIAEYYKAATGRNPWENVLVENELTNKKIVISVYPVTPDTSMKIDGNGHKQEREFILRMIKLCNLCAIKVEDEKIGTKYKTEFENYELKKKESDFSKKIDRFKKEFEKILDKNKLGGYLGTAISDINDVESWKQLRVAFAKTTIQLLPYDLVIMDEFQNFTDIINGANANINKRNILKRQRVMLAQFMDQLRITNDDSEYRRWLTEEVSGIKDLAEKTDDKNIERIEYGLGLLTKDDRERYKNRINSIKAEAEQDAMDVFRVFIDKMLQQSCDDRKVNSDEANFFEGKSWSIVKKIMECSYEEIKGFLQDSKFNLESSVSNKLEYDEECRKFFDERWEKKEKKSFNDSYAYTYTLSQELDINKMEKLYTFFRDDIKGKFYLQGVEIKKTPYCELVDWIIEKWSAAEEKKDKKEIEELRMFLLNLEVFHRNKYPDRKKDPDRNKDRDIDYLEDIYYFYNYIKEFNMLPKHMPYEFLNLWRGFILQSYKQQLFPEDERDTKTELVEQIFTEDAGGNTRILMLSATPFKMYMGANSEEEENNGTSETIDIVCDFLDESGK